VRNKYVGYVRVSTKRQGKDGLGADSQKNIINQYVSTRDGQLLQTFAEEESGKKINRPELEKAIALAKKENATLVIAKLDRLARNVYFTAKLMKSNVEFVCCDSVKQYQRGPKRHWNRREGEVSLWVAKIFYRLPNSAMK
jgi:DNA invertase Pin-like site-specific DNA recombinase